MGGRCRLSPSRQRHALTPPPPIIWPLQAGGCLLRCFAPEVLACVMWCTDVIPLFARNIRTPFSGRDDTSVASCWCCAAIENMCLGRLLGWSRGGCGQVFSCLKLWRHTDLDPVMTGFWGYGGGGGVGADIQLKEVIAWSWWCFSVRVKLVDGKLLRGIGRLVP